METATAEIDIALPERPKEDWTYLERLKSHLKPHVSMTGSFDSVANLVLNRGIFDEGVREVLVSAADYQVHDEAFGMWEFEGRFVSLLIKHGSCSGCDVLAALDADAEDEDDDDELGWLKRMNSNDLIYKSDLSLQTPDEFWKRRLDQDAHIGNRVWEVPINRYTLGRISAELRELMRTSGCEREFDEFNAPNFA